MGCAHTSWPCARAPMAATTTSTTSSGWSSLKRESISFHKPILVCCIDGPADFSASSSSARSYSRRWYNPLRRRRPLDQSLEIVRHWVESGLPLSPRERFTVVSYNILGDSNASKHRDLYSNVPSLYMKWNHRKQVICEELIGWNPDIICLQEVDKYFDLANIMIKAGYIGSYKRRTGNAVDGCAMFWKADKFRLLEGESIEFKGFGLRDNVAQLSVFEVTCKAESRRVLIGNLHVLYNPSRGDVKLGQIRLLSLKAHILSKKWGNVPVVLAGDFNSTPQSAIYKFLSSSKLNILLYDRRKLSGQRSCHPTQAFGVKRELRSPFILMNSLLNFWTDEEVKVATGNAGCEVATHPLQLNSSYATVEGSLRTRNSNGEPLATSYHSKFLGTVDYLWYSDGLVPVGVLDTLPIEILKRTGGLPYKKLGSDHLALVSEFGFA
ncbi:carbon catabolite repressor protein 4 homolog 3-like isoform X2 [Malania oleifera]|uniref:carbon catabolite repressor protein 4 homolog 3-like isoform X2 n=1 Tax=Malania oleifera TaxID=397392 RepID=UPI0025ADFDD4|nr:carbon catabolite repressor protein 4 homolog 3-like isoform X2 [Malania oleifera]